MPIPRKHAGKLATLFKVPLQSALYHLRRIAAGRASPIRRRNKSSRFSVIRMENNSVSPRSKEIFKKRRAEKGTREASACFVARNAYNDRAELVFHSIIRTRRAIYCSGNSFLGQQARVAREIGRGTRIVSKTEGGKGSGKEGREGEPGHPEQCQLRYRNITRPKRRRLRPIGANCSLVCWYRLFQIVYEEN